MIYYTSDLLGYIDELQRENIQYSANVKELTRKNNILRERVDLLEKENKELSDKVECLGNNNRELKKSKMMCTNQLMATVHSRNKYRHLYEQLTASSDLSMTAELAEIFAEFTVKDKENRDDLSVKIDEFREKYQSE